MQPEAISQASSSCLMSRAYRLRISATTSLQWETTRRFNVGIEANFLSNRLNLRANYFNSHISNLLTYQSLGWLSGLKRNWSNGGKMKNQGFDVTLSGKAIVTKDWQWELGVSVGHYKNGDSTA